MKGLLALEKAQLCSTKVEITQVQVLEWIPHKSKMLPKQNPASVYL